MFALSLTLAGCADAPGRIDRNAAHFNYTRIEVRGTDFSHVVYEKLKPIPDRALHVYLEGDGTPWVKERWVAADPTPRNPLMLRLMALDPADSIYVGRPCYHGFARIPPCTPELWTSGRYSREVVESMADVVRGILAKRGSKELCLFGHSGGGALAMLLADQLKSTRAVVTLAGNLDIDAWSHYHRYSPLTRSLNPVGETHLGNQVQQLHLVGSDDRRVPPALLEKAITHWPNAQFRVLEGFSHTCCWERVWPSVLSWVSGKG